MPAAPEAEEESQCRGEEEEGGGAATFITVCMENTPNWKHQLLRVLSERRNTSEQRSFIIPYKYFTVIAYWEERSFKNVVCKFQISVTDKLAVRGNAEPSQLSSTCTPPSLTLSKQERGALAACDSSQFLPLLAPCCHRSEHNTQPGASSAAERCDTSSKATSRWHIPLPPLDRRLQGV